MDTRMGFPCPFCSVVIYSVYLSLQTYPDISMTDYEREKLILQKSGDVDISMPLDMVTEYKDGPHEDK